jgi:hypothetical protein
LDALTVAETGDYFLRGGLPFFYLADTVWSAFVSVTPEEWDEYLSYRRRQGFNALQIAVLPQWDASKPHLDIAPFRRKRGGGLDYHEIDEGYFERAAGLLERAREYGFIPALVVLWCDYVRDTWLSRQHPERVMPYDTVRPYAEHVARSFSRFDPIYIISGDTDFESDETSRYYLAALEGIKSVSPHSLTAMHLLVANHYIPVSILRSGLLDFYMYQSGHLAEAQDMAYILARKFLENETRRPVVNGEPCYEGHARVLKAGRFNAFDVRRATWHSLLSGAKAGIAYGAHGVWGWHTKGKTFESTAISGLPYDWRVALRFRGAWDVAFARWLFETRGLFELEPRPDLEDPGVESSVAASDGLGKMAIYLPYNAEVEVNAPVPDFAWTIVDLQERRFARPEVRVEKDRTVFQAHAFEADALILGMGR